MDEVRGRSYTSTANDDGFSSGAVVRLAGRDSEFLKGKQSNLSMDSSSPKVREGARRCDRHRGVFVTEIQVRKN